MKFDAQNNDYALQWDRLKADDDGKNSFIIDMPSTNGNNKTALNYIAISGASIPEPSTATLRLLGLAGLLMHRHRA